ncbi:MAG: hypothetical protein AAFN78_06710 [Pseudomonadota bacterium]
MQQQIYRVDEVLLRVGTLLAVVVLFGTLAVQPWSARDYTGDFLVSVPGANGRITEIREQVELQNGNVPAAIALLEDRYPESLVVMPVLSWDFGAGTVVLALLAAGVIVMLLTGWRLRRVENRTLTIWKTLERHGRVSLREFVANSDFTRRQVLTAIRLINNRGMGFFAVDQSTGFVVDRKQHRTVSYAGDCDACGARVALEIAVPVIEAPRCPYCHSGLDVPAELLRPDPAPAPEPAAPKPLALSGGEPEPPQRGNGTPMSIPLFIVLVIICWPAAVGYAIYKFKAA